MIIAVVGLPGCGKTESSKFFINKGYHKVYFGDTTFDVMKQRGLEINEQNERATREGIRKEHGMAAYAILSYPKIKKLVDEGKNVLVESMYSWEEYIFLKEKFSDEEFKVVAIYSSPETRIKRLEHRKHERPLTRDETISRDYSQIANLHQAGPIARADFTIVNETTHEHLHAELDKIYNVLTKR